MSPNTYTIGESGGPTGYSKTSTLCSTDGGAAVETTSIQVDAGHSYVCTITNDDQAPSLTLVKHVTTDDGGSAVPEDWTLTATGDQDDPTVISGDGGTSSDGTFQSGTYTLSESAGPLGYTAGSWSCSGDVENVNDTVTLGIGESATCEITNDDQPGTLHIVKQVINDNGGTKTAGNFSFRVNGGSPTAFDETADNDDNALTGLNTVSVDAGSYAVTEDSVEGYGSTLGDDCSGTIANGEDVTCTITNDDGKSTLTIIKNTFGADGKFIFTLTGNDNIDITTESGTGQTSLGLDAGNYDLAEIVPAGWTLQGGHPVCEYDSVETGTPSVVNGENITLVAGDPLTCTFTDYATGADLSVVKTVDDSTPDNGQQITYTLTATNAGPGNAHNVVVHDALPGTLTFVSTSSADVVGVYDASTGDWTIGTLGTSSPAVLHITATLNASAGDVVTNTAVFSLDDEDVSDFNSDNNSGSSSVTVNTQTPPSQPTPPSGGGGNGPPVANGSVLGASTVGQVLGASCGLYLTDYLRIGRANNPDQVKKLQQFLNDEMNAGLPVNGVFGPATFNAVTAFQLKYASDILKPWVAFGLPTDHTPTGYVYKTTKRWVNLLKCPSLGIPMPQLP